MKRLFHSSKILRLTAWILTAVLLLTCLPAAVSGETSYGTVGRVVYVSSAGSDSAAGTRSAPFATVAKAFQTICGGTYAQNGGTIVLMNDVEPDNDGSWSNAVVKKYPHANLVTFTGKDPETGTVYPAKLRYNGVGLFGPTKFEYLTFMPSRSSLHINTCGKPLILGEGIEVGAYTLRFHDGIGETVKGTVESTDTTINSGKVQVLFVGGGYATSTQNGVTGDCRLTVNGGTVGRVAVGFDSYNAYHTDAQLQGNVTITVESNASVGEISFQRLYNNTIGGTLTIIENNCQACAVGEMPNAGGGAYHILSDNHGRVDATDTPGSFRVTADRGYVPEINGKTVESGVHTLSTGMTRIRYIRPDDWQVTTVEYAEGFEDGSFRPEEPISRAEALSLLYRVLGKPAVDTVSPFSDVTVTDWYYEAAVCLYNAGILPDGWETLDPNRSLTRGELVYLTEMTFPYASDSHKLYDFSDVSKDHPYYDAIMTAACEGRINGYENGSFRPEEQITRAETVTVINRYLGRLPVSGAEASFSDTAGHWASGQIAAACSDESEGLWVTDSVGDKYVLPASGSTADYVKALYEQSKVLSGQAIRQGIDVISEKMKETILNTADTLTVTGTAYYVSEQNGNDSNDGKSKTAPIKTLGRVSKLNLQYGDGVFFERGGIYRGGIKGVAGVTYAAYGEGPKPLLMQSRQNYADPALWEETAYPNVWKCTKQLTNVGIIGFDHDLFDYSDKSYDELYGKIMNLNTQGFTGLSDLKEDLQFYSDVTAGLGVAGDLFVYSEGGNPGSRFKSIEIGERVDIVDGSPSGCTIDNLAFKFTGAHAIGFGTTSDVVVTNCVFSWLGGSVLTKNDNGSAVNYGNAIEIYGGCKNYHVENCWMYQIYDTAVTHQRSSSTGNCTQEGIRYLSNLMEYVHWGIEFYNAPPTAEQLQGKPDTYTRYTKDVHDAYNVLRMGGFGWGSIVRNRTTSARLYCGATLSDNSDELTEYNIFDRCAGYLINLPANANEVDDKNIYVQILGNTLGLLKGSRYSCTMLSHRYIKEQLGDRNAVVVVVDRS